MEYKLIGRNNIKDLENCFFENRNVNPNEYLDVISNPTKYILDYILLDNVSEATGCILRHVNNDSNIGIIVDCDCDGQCSAAIIYDYIKRLNPNAKIKYYIHESKEHGLSHDIKINKGEIDLLIIPDAGTNDTDRCKELTDIGIDVVIIDHHEQDIDNPYAIIVNNQCSKRYSNKDACGAHIVWQVCRALDDITWNNYSDKYYDLVAIANIADNMDMRSYETRAVVELGLNRINNNFIDTIIDKRSFEIGGNLNITAVSFKIAPLVNAMCRIGTAEEKDIVFKAFIGQYEEYDYMNPRTKEFKTETIYERAYRLCNNAKSRQDNAVKKMVPIAEATANKNDAVVFANGNSVDKEFTGLVAMKLASKFKKPCLLLHESDNGFFKGSGRNCDGNTLELKSLLESSGMFEYTQGHTGAFGCSIKGENLGTAIDFCNKMCETMDFSVNVDFEVEYNKFESEDFHNIIGLGDYFGTGIKSPYVVLKNLNINLDDVTLMGEDKTSWKCCYDNWEIVKFTDTDGNVVTAKNEWQDNITINAICTLGINNFKGKITSQIIIHDYEVID